MDKITTTLFGVVALLALPASAPATESLEWLTDLSESYNGTEERLQLRSAPRLTLNYSMPRSAADRARAFNAEYGAIGHRWAVPLWMQTQAVGTIASADTTITCDTEHYEFFDSTLALVYQSNLVWALVEIDTVAPGELTLLEPVGVDFAGAYVMPVRLAFLRGAPTYNRTGFSELAQLQFAVEDNYELTGDAPAQFLDNDIYFDEQLAGETGYSATVLNREDLADYELGMVDRQTPWLYTRHQQAFQQLFDNPEDAWAFRLWLHRRAGKYRAFWMPSFENDMRKASTGTVTTLLKWKRDGYDNWFERTHIAIEKSDGTWLPRTLSSVSAFDADTMQGTLSSALGFDASAIRRISFLGLRRLVSDTTKLEWIGNAVVKANYSVVELAP